MDTSVARHSVGDIVEGVRGAVERQLGRRRKLYSAEDLIDDVGLTPEQFQDAVSEIEHHFGIEIDPETMDQLTVAGALVIRVMRLCAEAGGGEVENEVEEVA